MYLVPMNDTQHTTHQCFGNISVVRGEVSEGRLEKSGHVLLLLRFYYR